MKLYRGLMVLPAFAVLASASPVVQDEARPSDQTAPDATPTPAPAAFAKLRLGATATVVGAEGEPLGIARDHVLDSRSGLVVSTVIEVGQEGDIEHKLVAVPFEHVGCNADKNALALDVSLAELLEMPAFDPESIRATDPRAVVEAASTDEVRPVRLLAAALTGAPVLGAGEDFGEVNELVLDVKGGNVAFLVVQGGVPSAHGLRYLVPWSATEWTPPSEDGERPGSFHLPMSVPELAEAPKLERTDIRILENPSAVEHILRYYGIERPVNAEVSASGDRRASG